MSYKQINLNPEGYIMSKEGEKLIDALHDITYPAVGEKMSQKFKTLRACVNNHVKSQTGKGVGGAFMPGIVFSGRAMMELQEMELWEKLSTHAAQAGEGQGKGPTEKLHSVIENIGSTLANVETGILECHNFLQGTIKTALNDKDNLQYKDNFLANLAKNYPDLYPPEQYLTDKLIAKSKELPDLRNEQALTKFLAPSGEIDSTNVSTLLKIMDEVSNEVGVDLEDAFITLHRQLRDTITKIQQQAGAPVAGENPQQGLEGGPADGGGEEKLVRAEGGPAVAVAAAGEGPAVAGEGPAVAAAAAGAEAEGAEAIVAKVPPPKP